MISLGIGLGLSRQRRSGSSDSTAPTLSSATLNAAGTSLTLVFSESVTFGAGGNGGWSFSGLGLGASTLSYASGSGTATLVYTASRAIADLEVVTLNYTQPGNGVEDAAGNDLATIVARAVTNNSTATGNPLESATSEFWDTRLADFAVTGAGRRVTTWTGRKSANTFTGAGANKPVLLVDGSGNYYVGFDQDFNIPGAFTSGTFTDGEIALQAATGAYGVVNGAQSAGGNLQLTMGHTGGIIENSVNTWVGQSSGAIFTPSGGRSAGLTVTNYLSSTFGRDRRAHSTFVVMNRKVTSSDTVNVMSSTSDQDTEYFESGSKRSHYNGGSTLNPTIYVMSSLGSMFTIANGATDMTLGFSRNTPAATNSTGEDTAKYDFNLNPAGSSTTTSLGAGISGSFPLSASLVRCVVVYNRALNSAETDSVLDWLTLKYKATSRSTATMLVTVGDSITEGIGAAVYSADSWPAQFQRLCAVPPKLSNRGVAGASVYPSAGIVIDSALVDTDFSRNTWATNKVLVVFAGTNDISVNGRTSAQIITDLTNYITARKGATVGLKVYCGTILNKASFSAGDNTKKDAINAAIKALSLGNDGYIDFQANAQMQDSTQSSKWALDQVHPNATGYGYMAVDAYAALAAASVGIS